MGSSIFPLPWGGQLAFSIEGESWKWLISPQGIFLAEISAMEGRGECFFPPGIRSGMGGAGSSQGMFFSKGV
jgi:hypothetical protein